MARSKNFIKKAIGGHKGKLHKKLGIPLGKKIPAKVLKKAAKAPGKLGKEARFAIELKSFRKKK